MKIYSYCNLILLSVFLLSCKNPEGLVTVPCQVQKGSGVAEFINGWRSTNDSVFTGKKTSSIIDGSHIDIFQPKKGFISSKKWKWTLNLNYTPFLLYEGDKTIVVSVSRDLQEGTLFASNVYRWYVIDKQHGSVLRYFESKLSSSKEAVLDGYFYIVIFDGEKKVYCLSLNDD